MFLKCRQVPCFALKPGSNTIPTCDNDFLIYIKQRSREAPLLERVAAGKPKSSQLTSKIGVPRICGQAEIASYLAWVIWSLNRRPPE